jgi:hypothetical protein
MKGRRGQDIGDDVIDFILDGLVLRFQINEEELS